MSAERQKREPSIFEKFPELTFCRASFVVENSDDAQVTTASQVEQYCISKYQMWKLIKKLEGTEDEEDPNTQYWAGYLQALEDIREGCGL